MEGQVDEKCDCGKWKGHTGRCRGSKNAKPVAAGETVAVTITEEWLNEQWNGLSLEEKAGVFFDLA